MPLSHIVHVLNSSSGALARRLGPELRFVPTRSGACACYGVFRLESRFMPLLEAETGLLRGHGAVLAAARLDDQSAVAPGQVFGVPDGNAGVAQLDQLVRTLHALNYLLEPQPGLLLLKVHPRASGAVDWGLAYDDILRPCGLVPERIVLELASDALMDGEAWRRAVRRWRDQGYGIAVKLAGAGIDFGLLRDLRPELVKLPWFAGTAEPPAQLVGALHDLGALVMVEGQGAAGAPGVDLVQVRDPDYCPAAAADVPERRPACG